MGQKQAGRTLYTVSCPCGARASMDARMFGRPNVCRKCGGSFTVGWGKDPISGKTTPMAVTLARKRSDAILQVHCACGYRRAVTPAEAAERNRCPGCGRDMIVEKPPPSKTGPTRVPAPSSRQASSARQDRAAAPAAPPPKLQIVCACGYRRAVTPSEAAGRNRCPGCGKEMLVEKPAGRKRESDRIIKLSSAPTARSKPAAASVQLVQLPPGTQAFNCLCGERIMVRAGTIGSVTQCRICDRQIRVETGTPPAPPTPLPGGRYPTPPPASYSKPELTCECGQALEVLKALGANGTVCPRCGQTVVMEKVRAPLSKHTMIRPKFGAKPGLPPTPPPPTASAPPPPPRQLEPEPELPVAEFQEEPEEQLVKVRRSSFQEVFCPCGEALTVSNDEAGRNIQCPTCFTLMAVERIADGNTGNHVLRVRAIGKMDQDTWSLSEFS